MVCGLCLCLWLIVVTGLGSEFQNIGPATEKARRPYVAVRWYHQLMVGSGTKMLSKALTFDLLNPKSVGFDIVSRTTTVSSFKSMRSGIFVQSC